MSVKVTSSTPVEPPVVIELDSRTSLKLAGLLVAAVRFADNEWAEEIYNGVIDATHGSSADFSLNDEIGFFEESK